MFQNYILLEEFLKSNGYSYLKDNDLKNYNTFKIGGKADLMVFPDNEENPSGRRISFWHAMAYRDVKTYCITPPALHPAALATAMPAEAQ